MIDHVSGLRSRVESVAVRLVDESDNECVDCVHYISSVSARNIIIHAVHAEMCQVRSCLNLTSLAIMTVFVFVSRTESLHVKNEKRLIVSSSLAFKIHF